MKNKTLIIGASGNIGSKLLKLFNTSTQDYKLLARNQSRFDAFKDQGHSSIIGDLADKTSLSAALVNIETVFLLSSPEHDMFDLHKNLIDAAVNANVKKIVRISGEPANDNADVPLYGLHADADQYLINSGLNYVILRPHYFMQNIPTMHMQSIEQTQSFAQYLGDTKIPLIDVLDIAQAAFNALASGAFDNKIFTLTGPESLSFSEIATLFSDHMGRKISYMPISYETQKAGFEAAHLPAWISNSVMAIFKKWATGTDHKPVNDIEVILGRKATSFDAFLKNHLK